MTDSTGSSWSQPPRSQPRAGETYQTEASDSEVDAIDIASLAGSRERRALACNALERQRQAAFKRGFYPSKARRHRGAYSESAQRTHDVEDDHDERSPWRNRPGMARSKTGTGRSRFDPQPLKRVVGEMSKKSGWSTTISIASIALKWNDIVGPTNAEHCPIETFDDQVLVVRASSTAWANQMRLLLPMVERRIRDELGAGVVKQVIIRGPSGPSWKKGRWSVPGRGPRDTYG
ncbi:MAG: DciA family protein [Actinomycetaceae bacterium]|nr:DciA family protein [Actinomycetaceae bacterium]